MAQYEHLPIYRKAFDLRNISRKIVRLIIRANSERDKVPTLEEVRVEIEELKVTARICKEVKAFKNFNSFKHMMGEIISLGKQCEGWFRSMRGR
ncbi:MAG: four helix bundle protein [Candidatus Omnitrophica bacterium]|nr:four helix bundle protein [Candidatus Omnitrophota bacterium]